MLTGLLPSLILSDPRQSTQMSEGAKSSKTALADEQVPKNTAKRYASAGILHAEALQTQRYILWTLHGSCR